MMISLDDWRTRARQSPIPFDEEEACNDRSS